MQTEQVIGIIAGILTSTSMLPQLIKLVREKKAEAISPVMLVVLICGLSLWVYYGILKNDWPIIITNVFAWLLNAALLILRQIYRKKGR
jgi:MtN3 and saliva related transmembrane protein